MSWRTQISALWKQKINWKQIIFEQVLMIIGVVIGALGVVLFLIPFNIAPGGVTGLSIIINNYINIPVGTLILVLNVPIMFLAYRMLPNGLMIVLRSILAVILYSLLIDLMTVYIPSDALSSDPLLSTVFGGVLTGLGGGLVYRSGGSSGGTSTLALIVQRKLGTPMSTTFLYTDIAVLIVAGITFGWEAALYAIVALFLGGIATDYAMEGPSVIRTGVIITNKPREVADAILYQLHRGVTAWDSKGMYTEQERTVLYVTISRSQMREFRRLVTEIDPESFIVIGQGHTAYGEGFKQSAGVANKKAPDSVL